MLLNDEQGQGVASDALAKEISELSVADSLRLKKASEYHSRLTRYSSSDLLQEAFARVLEGVRQCGDELGLVPFLIGVMKSIASSDRKSQKRHPESSLLKQGREDDAGRNNIEIDLQDESPTPEQIAISRQQVANIRQNFLTLFEDNLVAQTVLEGIMEGMDPSEIQELTGLDVTSYASMRRLIRRRIDKAFPGGVGHE